MDTSFSQENGFIGFREAPDINLKIIIIHDHESVE